MLFSVEEPQYIIEKLKQYFDGQGFPVEESNKKYRLKAKCECQNEQTIIRITVEQIEENVNSVRLSMVEGNKMDFFKSFNEIQTEMRESEVIL